MSGYSRPNSENIVSPITPGGYRALIREAQDSIFTPAEPVPPLNILSQQPLPPLPPLPPNYQRPGNHYDELSRIEKPRPLVLPEKDKRPPSNPASASPTARDILFKDSAANAPECVMQTYPKDEKTKGPRDSMVAPQVVANVNANKTWNPRNSFSAPEALGTEPKFIVVQDSYKDEKQSLTKKSLIIPTEDYKGSEPYSAKSIPLGPGLDHASEEIALKPGMKKNQQKRICGIRERVFQVILVVLILAILAIIGGTVGGVMAANASSKSKTTAAAAAATTTSSSSATTSTTPSKASSTSTTSTATATPTNDPNTMTVWSGTNFAGSNHTYSQPGGYKLDFSANSYTWTPNSQKFCCVRMCFNTSSVGFRCSAETNQPFSSAPFNKILIYCGSGEGTESMCAASV